MVRQILPISALLIGSAFLLFAGGINALLLPVRGSIEGFTAFSLGLLGTGWAIGYVSGCALTSGLVARVGHVRAFSAMSAIAAVSILGSALLLTPVAWIVLRGVCGFCFAGAAMIVESWLSERAAPETRGRIFGIYTMVNLAASTAGQLMLTLGDPAGFTFFALGAIFYCLALVPTAISSTSTPAPLVSVRLDLRGLWRNSPVAVFAVFCVGISNAAFGALAAVYAERVGLMLTAVAVFTSVPILAGAVAQIPVGILSDRTDRRKVLVGVAVLALIADLAFIFWAPTGRTENLLLAALLGGSIFALYPIIVAHANDHAAPGTAIQISGGLLLIFGLGSVVGPLVAGWGMTNVGNSALYWVTAGAHILIILYTLYRMSRRAPVAEAAKGSFQPVPGGRISTPQTALLAETDQGEMAAARDDAEAAHDAARQDESEAHPQNAPR
ncbi:membrane protein, major facilitator transporter family [Oceaniovalibus guishaninsula JLT2003]|uniref:Membrane protein, major facilitator transporter family n=1 Tax=Oceaniovalibus guishaninsula JLT2003 TaxID=1231392 RepID=K2I6Z9_9RHOB|nr:MFS transporter [Oceaniovalibus guishaninsula]EKE44785.1 membrane protein, major facilitator transporter family [Oceaniovalibus guishaninsula JLT2003]